MESLIWVVLPLFWVYRCKTGLERPTYRPRFTFGVVVKQGPVYLFYIENCFDKSGFKFSFKGIFCSVGGGGKLCFLAKAMVAFYGHLKGGVVFRPSIWIIHGTMEHKSIKRSKVQNAQGQWLTQQLLVRNILAIFLLCFDRSVVAILGLKY